MSAAPITLLIPRPPDNANSRKHWAVVARDKQTLWSQLNLRAQSRYGFPEKPKQPIARAEVRIVWHHLTRSYRPDPDNVVRRMKPVFDWLVMNAWLAGDTADHLVLRTPEFVLGTAGLPKLCSVEITLTPVDT